MDKYISIVFNSDEQASEGLHALWKLDKAGEITVHGATVVHRDFLGQVDVSTKKSNVGVRTAIGVGVGAILGALAGPIGVAAGAGAALAAAGGAGAVTGIGAALGGVAGITGDTIKADEHDEASYDSSFDLRSGQAAVVAEVSEDYKGFVDRAMREFGGTITRRDLKAVREDSIWSGQYLYPYDYYPYYNPYYA